MAYPGMPREYGAGRFHAWLLRVRDRLPVACLLCGERAAGGLCAGCRVSVGASMRGGPRCPRCDLGLGKAARPGAAGGSACPDCLALSPSFERVLAAFDYAWPGELLIHALKRRHRYGCAPVLAALLGERCEAARRVSPDALWCPRATLVVPVPAGRRSLARRGFNPAAEVGRELARRLGLAWRPGLLRRVRDGDPQKGLAPDARRASVAGLYECAGSVAGRDILAVDDVMTTGSTLDAVARVLKEHGAAKVWGAVAARTPLRRPEM